MKLLQASFCASAACLALATLSLAATAPAFAQDAFKVGIVSPMSGANARYGAFANKGAALAAKEITSFLPMTPPAVLRGCRRWPRVCFSASARTRQRCSVCTLARASC